LRNWRPWLEALEDRLAPAVITVNSTADTASPPTGTVTLRSAILAANASPGSTIDFNIPGISVQVIQPGSALPTITAPVVINGYSQPGSSANTEATGDNAVLEIELNGSVAGAVNGLVINANNTTIEGLNIQKFAGDGIALVVGNNCLIAGNFIGTDATGTMAAANGVGVEISNGSHNNTIGGTVAGARNVISGNTTGIFISGSNTSGNVVQGNYIGTDVTGGAALGNRSDGVDLVGGATDNTVGGAVPAARNVISGNLTEGALLSGFGSNALLGNYIGISAAGGAGVPNRSGGVKLANGARGNTIGGTVAGAGNVISGNDGDGILLNDAPANQVLGNLIGTNAAGTAALPNGRGIKLINFATDNLIGGTTPGARNVISGNAVDGILIISDPAQAPGTAGGNQVIHNFIGTNAAGSAAVPNHGNGVDIISDFNGQAAGNTISGNVISGNGVSGVRIFGGASTRRIGSTRNVVVGNFIGTDAGGNFAIGNHFGVVIGGMASRNTIGGTSATARNIISGNSGTGILINGTGTISNVVAGNRIGTDLTGTDALPNGLHGVGIYNGASGNTIGGTSAGTANRIAFNRGAGVVVVGSSTVNDSILGNAIFGNIQLGIDLGADGVTPNDPINPDTGPNNRQNYPVLTSAVTTNSGTTITGTLQSAKSAMFRVEFFSAPVTNPSGHGQGKNFLGFTTVTTDASGNGSFTFNTAAPVSVGLFASATATDAFGDTSEFSQDVKVTSGTGTTLGAAADSPDMLGLVRAIALTGSVEQNAPVASPPLARPPTSTVAALPSPLWDSGHRGAIGPADCPAHSSRQDQVSERLRSTNLPT
jgi:titin